MKNFNKYDFKAFNAKETLITLTFMSPEDVRMLFDMDVGDIWTAMSVFCMSSSSGHDFKEILGIDYLQCDWKEEDKIEEFELNHSGQTVYQFQTENDTYNLFTVKNLDALELLDLFKINYEEFGSYG